MPSSSSSSALCTHAHQTTLLLVVHRACSRKLVERQRGNLDVVPTG